MGLPPHSLRQVLPATSGLWLLNISYLLSFPRFYPPNKEFYFVTV